MIAELEVGIQKNQLSGNKEGKMNMRTFIKEYKLKRYLFILLSFSWVGQSFAQNSIQERITNKLQEAAAEKVFVHVSQTFLVTGETLWFKIYVTAGAAHLLSPVSKVAYATLSDVSQKQVLQAKIAIDSGSGGGSWVIPASLGSGQYLLNAYTNLTKNATDPLFQQWITIINPSKPPTPASKSQPINPTIQFFPEGGELVNGITSTMGFKVTGNDGKPLQASGAIISKSNDTLSRFKTQHAGIGRCVFTPNALESYKVVLFINGKSSIVNTIPAIKQNGYTVHLIETSAEGFNLELQTNLDNTGESMTVLLHGQQTVFKAIPVVLKRSKASVFIPSSTLPEGVITATVFNNSYEAVAERLLFIKPVSNASLQTTVTNTTVSKRETVPVNLIAKKDNGMAAKADLSVAIFKIDSLQSVPESNISQYLSLTSSLKGTIDDPGFYFTETPEAKEGIENLLLTHGWRKVSNSNNNSSTIPEYSGHIITGIVTNKVTGLPAKRIRTFLTVPGERFHFSNCLSDDNGRIQFDVKKIYGTESIIVQSNPLTDSIYRFTIDNPFVENKDLLTPPSITVALPKRNLLEERIAAAQIQTAYSNNRFQTFYLPQYNDTTSFYGKPDKVYMLDDYTRFTTMEEVIREYVAEIQLRKSGNQFRFKVLNMPFKQYFEENPLVLLDGLPVFDMNKIIAMDPLKIRKLDVLNRRYYQGNFAFDGIASFLTYNGDLAGYSLDPTALVVEYAGLQLQRQFYQPDFTSAGSQDQRLPDYRQLLYWSGDIKTGRDGNASLNFITSDIPGNYVIITQGITADGKPLYFSKGFTVK